MNKFVKKLTCGILVTIMAITAITGCGKKEALDGTKVLISNEEQSLNVATANFVLRSYQAQMQSYLESYGDTTNVWAQYGPSIKDSTLSTIQNMLVMEAHAADYNVVITEEEQAGIEAAAAAFVEDNGEEVMKTLGMSQEDVERVLALYTYQSKMYEPMVADVDTNVTDEEAAQTTVSYLKMSFVEADEEGNRNEVAADEKEARKAAIQEGLDQMLAAEDVMSLDLNALAEELDENMVASASLSFSTNDTEEASSVIDTAVREAAVANLEDAAVIDHIIEGEDAYYAVRVELAFDEEATAEEKEAIVQERQNAAYTELITKWVEEAAYTIDEELWEDLEVTDSHLYIYKAEEAEEEAVEE